MKGAKVRLYLQHNVPTIVSGISAVGVVATTIAAVKATPKALLLIENEKESINKQLKEDGWETRVDKLSATETIKTVWKCYIPTAIIGLSTIVCIFGANALNKRQQAAIASAYIMLDNAFKQYKEKVNDLLDDNADAIIKKSIIEDHYSDIALFYEYHYGEFFERSKADVLNAEYSLNLKFASQGYACLNDFFELLGLPITREGEVIGWTAQEGYSAIDFEHQLLELNDGMECTIINLPISPSICY